MTSGDTTEMICPKNYKNQNQLNVVLELLANCRFATSRSGWYAADFRRTRALHEANQRGTPVRWLTSVSSVGTQVKTPFVLVDRTWAWKRAFIDSRGDRQGPVIAVDTIHELSVESIDRALAFEPNNQRAIELMIAKSLRDRGIPSVTSEKYLTFINAYFSVFHKAISREKFRKLQATTRVSKLTTERLANTVTAITLLGEMIDNPNVREKLFYKVDPFFFMNPKKDVPCLFIYNRQARKILSKHLCSPVKMTKRATLKALAEELSQEMQEEDI